MSSPPTGSCETVLLGAAGTGTAFGAATALRRQFSQRVRIVAMDTNPPHLVTTSLLADAFETVPPSASAAFPEALLRVIGTHGVTTYLPLIDEEIARAADLAAAGELPAVRLLAPGPVSARICLDKWAAAEWMRSRGVPTPWTALATDTAAEGPFFLKPRRGFGSRGARLVSRAELEALPLEQREASVVQTVCAPPEVTVDAFHAPVFGFLRVACRERLESKSGVCTKARVHHDEELEELALVLATGLGLEGTFCFQAMRDGGHWAVTDINARPGAGTAMSAAVGLDFFAAAFALAWGLDPRSYLPPLLEEAHVTRQYAEFVMG